jgi:Flp pilus assembly protein TadG
MRRPHRARHRGAVLVEYALLLVTFFIPVSMGILAGGIAMMHQYEAGREHLLKATP